MIMHQYELNFGDNFNTLDALNMLSQTDDITLSSHAQVIHILNNPGENHNDVSPQQESFSF